MNSSYAFIVKGSVTLCLSLLKTVCWRWADGVGEWRHWAGVAARGASSLLLRRRENVSAGWMHSTVEHVFRLFCQSQPGTHYTAVFLTPM